MNRAEGCNLYSLAVQESFGEELRAFSTALLPAGVVLCRRLLFSRLQSAGLCLSSSPCLINVAFNQIPECSSAPAAEHPQSGQSKRLLPGLCGVICGVAVVQQAWRRPQTQRLVGMDESRVVAVK